MNRLHVVGRKNHGKTLLITELVREFCRRGVHVGTIKHSPHVHELDAPGKDSHRHRLAGGQPAAIITAECLGLFLQREPDLDPYAALAPQFASCDVVLVEGDIDTSARKVEVWRASLNAPCLAMAREDIAAVISDDQPEVPIPVWPRGDIPQLADLVLGLFHRT
jgi:molybdopterin-guanine dinucleotide biosynthesis protein MobB